VTHAKYMWANLLRNKVRTLFTLFSLVSAFTLYGLLQPVHQVFTEGPSLDQAGRLIVAPKYSIADMLPVRIAGQIEALPGVSVTAHMTWFGGTYIDTANFFPQYAVTPEAYLEAMPELVLSDQARSTGCDSRSGDRREIWHAGGRVRAFDS